MLYVTVSLIEPLITASDLAKLYSMSGVAVLGLPFDNKVVGLTGIANSLIAFR